jgi:hypothetical protein
MHCWVFCTSRPVFRKQTLDFATMSTDSFIVGNAQTRMIIFFYIPFFLFLNSATTHVDVINKLIFPQSVQYGTFVNVSIASKKGKVKSKGMYEFLSLFLLLLFCLVFKK